MKGKWLNLAILITGALVALLTIGFGIYYYRDRYVHPNVSLLERETQRLEQMVHQDPQNADLRVMVATVYLEKGLLDQAITQAEEAINIDPNHQDGLIILGLAYVEQGKDEHAIPLFAKVVGLSEGSELAMIDMRLELAHYNLGMIYFRQGQHAMAIQELQDALLINPGDADARYSLATAFNRDGNCESAIPHYEQTVRFVPDFLEAYQGMEACYQQLGMEDEATYSQGMVQFAQGNYDEARILLEEAMEHLPASAPLYIGLGLTYERLGETERAISSLEEALQYDPHSVVAIQALGRLQLED